MFGEHRAGRFDAVPSRRVDEIPVESEKEFSIGVRDRASLGEDDITAASPPGDRPRVLIDSPVAPPCLASEEKAAYREKRVDRRVASANRTRLLRGQRTGNAQREYARTDEE
jgi:hypothetical protein